MLSVRLEVSDTKNYFARQTDEQTERGTDKRTYGQTTGFRELDDNRRLNRNFKIWEIAFLEPTSGKFCNSKI